MRGHQDRSKQLFYCPVGVTSPSCTYPRTLRADTAFAGTQSQMQMRKVSGLRSPLQQLFAKLVVHFVLKMRSTLINMPFKNAVIKKKAKNKKKKIPASC